MSINWLIAVPTPKGVDIPTYGNYGGPNYSDGRVLSPSEDSPLTTPPVDALDALFREHDSVYGESSDPLVLATADLQLIRGIALLSDAQLSSEAHLYAGAATLAFIDQINFRWGHPELFEPGEEARLAQGAWENLQEGRVNPEPEEIHSVPERLADLLEFAQGGTEIVLNDPEVLVSDALYFSQNPDVFFSKLDPDTHYAEFGWREGRDPNAYFSTVGYLAANGDVKAAGINPLEHYHQSGWREGRDPSAWFDTTLYLQAYADVKAAGLNPLEHYLTSGQAEGRQIFAAVGRTIQTGFDAEFYYLANPDVARAGVDAFTHFQVSGWREGRDPNAYFDASAYLSVYTDVAAAGINPLEHYMLSGWREGRDPSGAFDTSSYLSAYTDIAAANINPLQHFLQTGIYEGRSSFADGAIG